MGPFIKPHTGVQASKRMDALNALMSYKMEEFINETTAFALLKSKLCQPP